MTAALRFERYRWARGEETTVRTGPAGGPTVLMVPPLFEEANRSRAILAAVLRSLASLGIGGALPDLPGQGDSLVPTRDARLGDWRAALAGAATALPRPVHLAAIRGGALLGGEARVASRWYLAPLDGGTLARELRRQRSLSSNELFAGNDLSPVLVAALEAAEPSVAEPLRVVRLADDGRGADRHVAAAPPWRGAEPGRDDALAATLADDLADWIATCAVR